MIVLTPQERNVLLFVTGVWLAGLCIRSFVLVHPACRVFIAGEMLKIPLNAVSYEDLLKSRLVSPALCRGIIEYRRQNGAFRVLEDLKNVRGIGDKRFEKLKGIFYLP
jgi:competence ComEA-like helix-hairpin-helix protein